jgi:hypothetical protein
MADRRTPGVPAGATSTRIGGMDVSGGDESVLGLRRRGTHFSINPCIPSSWPAYEMTWRVETTRYVISVSNPGRLCRGVVESSVDGVGVNPGAIPLVLDGGTHQVQIRLGTVSESAKAPAFPEAAAAVLPAGTTRM